jgi:hypothetical protein
MARRKSKSGAVAAWDAMIAALAIRLREAASFQEKLRQLVGKCDAKRKGARKRAPSMSGICRVRGKF